MKPLILVFLISVYGILYPHVPAMAQEYLVKNVHILTLNNEKVLDNHTIHVKDGKIFNIYPVSGIPSGLKRIQQIDGKGTFAFPGLAEMHSHIPITETGDFSYIQDVMWLYLANGILNVRGMIGHSSHLELKKKIEKGEIIGPRIFAAGQSLNGASVESPEMGERMVRDQHAAGFDHLKLHPGLDMTRFLTIAKTAKEVDIKFGGHVSLDVGLENSLQHGYKSAEHMDGYIEALIEDKSKLDPQIAGPFSMLLVKEVDMSKLPSLVQLTLEKKAWIAPTLTLFERFFGYIPADEFRLEDEMKYMPGIQVQQWVNQKKLLENQGVLKEDNVKPYLEFRQKLLKTLYEAGVPILLSSDSPQVFNVPGFSIHNEIKSMYEAGLSPLDILKTGSKNVAVYFEREGEFGEISIGADADFVLLSGNPLSNLGELKNVRGLMLRGQWISQEKLTSELKRIEEKNIRK
ncbi:amidohydrolase family protein [Cecembia rubra]|uniref:amidohydrolase family protein n=1 Tax=Cecembia rubra TaxID=1485585 RepID=UPI0027155CA7|nr:amidohydrolase family protein [Cecembia rubra]